MANYDLGVLSSQIVSRNNFSVTPRDRTDVFEFDIRNRRSIGLHLHGMNGDADIRLFRDTNRNGRLDRFDRQVATSRLGGTRNDTIDFNATAGTYFAQVERFSGPTFLRYSLDLAATYDVGRLGTRTISRNRYSVTPSDSTDVFEFDATRSSNVNVSLNNISRGDNVDLRVFRDSNNNGVFDADDRLVASSRNGGNRDEVVNFFASRGTYFAQASRSFPSRGSALYDIDISQYTPSFDVGILRDRPTQRNNFTVSRTDREDVFEFDLLGTRTINLNLHDISRGDDVDLRLYRDNGNGVFDSGDRLLARSSRGGNRDDSINYRAGRGTYFAEVRHFRGTGLARYDLDMSATFSRASNLLSEEVQVGNLSRDRLLRGGVNDRDTTDTYAFSLGLFEGTNIRLSGLRSDADIRVIRDRNNNGIVDAGEVVGSSTRGGTLSDSINGLNQSGNYFLQVYQFRGNTNYQVRFDHYTTPFA